MKRHTETTSKQNEKDSYCSAATLFRRSDFGQCAMDGLEIVIFGLSSSLLEPGQVSSCCFEKTFKVCEAAMRYFPLLTVVLFQVIL